MKVDIFDNNCAKCNGVDSCKNYCVLHAGKAMVDFLNRVDVIETRIGERTRTTGSVRDDLIVSGHQIWNLNQPSWILTDIKTSLETSNKFNNVCDKNAIKVIRDYAALTGISDEEVKGLIERIRAISSNKLLILPIKPMSKCKVNSNGKKAIEGEIANLKWYTDRETYKLNCIVTINTSYGERKSFTKHRIEDYLKEFKLDQLNNNCKATDDNCDILNMTAHGVIQPITVEDKTGTLSLDGTYLYQNNGAGTHIVGYWDSRDELVCELDGRNKAFKKIKDNIELIKSHKRFIAPYMFYKSNVITL
jgi:hypothetical protein